LGGKVNSNRLTVTAKIAVASAALLQFLAMSSTASVASDYTPEQLYGNLMFDKIARLTWAEKNCSGRASDGVRELRLHFRKKFNAEFEEALIRDAVEIRESTDMYRSKSPGKDSDDGICLSMNWLFGARGSSLPGLWRRNSEIYFTTPTPSPDEIKARWGHPGHLKIYGKFASALSDLYYYKNKCKGIYSTIAEEFTAIFIAISGVENFKKLAEDQIDLPSRLDTTCEDINRLYGFDSEDWPVLWMGQRNYPKSNARSNEKNITSAPEQIKSGTPPVIDQKRINLPQGVSFELPTNWIVGAEKDRQTVEMAVQSMGKWTVNGSAGLLSTLYTSNLEIAAQASFRFYTGNQSNNITQPDVTNMSPVQIAEVGDQFKQGMTKSAMQTGTLIFGWKPSVVVKAGGFVAVVTEYQSRFPHESVTRHNIRARVYDGPLSFSVLLSHDDAQRTELRPVLDGILQSVNRSRP
jgi:hypothetical protein